MGDEGGAPEHEGQHEEEKAPDDRIQHLAIAIDHVSDTLDGGGLTEGEKAVIRALHGGWVLVWFERLAGHTLPVGVGRFGHQHAVLGMPLPSISIVDYMERVSARDGGSCLPSWWCMVTVNVRLAFPPFFRGVASVSSTWIPPLHSRSPCTDPVFPRRSLPGTW